MKIIAAAVVAFDKTVPAPRAPNTVWLPPPPKVPPSPRLCPVATAQPESEKYRSEREISLTV
jgi:hypothetical protein